MRPVPNTTYVSFRSRQGTIRYEDTADHFQNAVLRLMKMDVPKFEEWLDAAEREAGTDLLERLGRGLRQLNPLDEPAALPDDHIAVAPATAELLHPVLANAPGHGIAVLPDRRFGWLVRRENDRWLIEIEPPSYDSGYFELGPLGYAGYSSDEAWRIAKGRTQLTRLEQSVGVSGGRALDVGSAYGYFRVALEEAGFEHYGVDVSEHARATASDRFGFDTHPGELTEYVEVWDEHFTLVTLWDVLEHTGNPRALLEAAIGCLRPGGILALRTPSLDCPEADYLGPFYHSFQRAHLVYFTPVHLEELLDSMGVEVRYVETPSHLLRGFVGKKTAEAWSKARRGSDITVHCVKA